MKLLLFYASLIAIGVSIPAPQNDTQNNSMEHMRFFLYEDENGQIQFEDLVNAEIDLTEDSLDVTYYYYSQKDRVNGRHILPTDINALKNTAFNAAKESIFIVHGWKNSHESDVNSHIRESLLKSHDVNVFVVDWSPIAGKNYVSAQSRVVRTGQLIADFIRSLVSHYHLQLNKVKLVGHSLGAHISGNAGAALNGQIERIVGLDPAGPLFTSSINNRLDPTDAKYVQAIHTNAGVLGFNKEVGHSDYYPNGGRSQPGCGTDLTGSCAHGRSYAYYAESLNSNKFVSRKCAGWDAFNSGKCSKNAESSMGMFNIDTRASGNYYLKTKNSSPFAEG